MDEKFRERLLKVNEDAMQKVLAATNLDEYEKAMSAYKMVSELLLKYDMAVDSHDENVEKILNAQENDNKKIELESEKLEHEKEIDERKLASDSKWKNKDFWLNVGKGVFAGATTVGVVIATLWFDGKGVIFTSQAAKQILPSILKGVSNSTKL